MPLSVLEVAIYAMVLSAAQPKPYECVKVEPDGVNCTNGLAALPEAGGMKFNNGVSVYITRDRSVLFSNGIRIHMDSSMWAHFKRGEQTLVSARRMDPRGTRFNFNNGYTCQFMGKEQDQARCFKP